MKNSTTIYLVRHGETEWNVKKILQGQSDSPLTEKGLHQAHVLGENFKETHFDAIYSSDIGRAKTTAEIIAQYHQLQVQTSDLIRERYFGKFQGRFLEDMQSELKQEIEGAQELNKEERMAYKLTADMETDQEIVSRVYRFFQKINSQHVNKTILTVCHGALMRVFLTHLDIVRYGQFDNDSIDNLGYIVIETDGKEIDVLQLSGIHLKGTRS